MLLTVGWFAQHHGSAWSYTATLAARESCGADGATIPTDPLPELFFHNIPVFFTGGHPARRPGQEIMRVESGRVDSRGV